MIDQSISRKAAYLIQWVPVSVYCQLHDVTVSAVRTRRRRGIWLDGKHTTVKDGRLYVNLPEVDRWIAESAP